MAYTIYHILQAEPAYIPQRNHHLPPKIAKPSNETSSSTTPPHRIAACLLRLFPNKPPRAIQTTIRIHTDALSPQLVEVIRAGFPNQVVDIVVRAASDAVAEDEAGSPQDFPSAAGSIPPDVYSLPPSVYSPTPSGYSLPPAAGNRSLPAGNSPVSVGDKREPDGNTHVAAGNSEEAAGNTLESEGNNGGASGNIHPSCAVAEGLPTEEALLAVLHRAMPDVVHSTSLRGSARLLLHLAGQTTGNTGKLLAERSGFTYSGAAKHMMLLRRRGLVVRRGWRHYTLTEKASGYLAAAQEAS